MATGTLSPEPYLTVVNASGVPYVGAKVFTYIAGTTTPAATYTDVGLTVPNANPIITDSAGRYTVFLAPGASYKYVIQDANGVAIKTIDNISGGATSSNTDITGTAGETLTAGQAVYLSDGSGGKTVGQWYKADPANAYSSTLPQIGLVPATIASGSSGTIRMLGSVSGLSSLTIGTTYYVGTAGAITSTAPANSRVLGVADTTSSLVISPNPGLPNTDNGINDFRLTLTTGVPVTTADVTAATTIFCTPAGKGNRIALYTSAGVATVYTSAEFSIAVPATTSQAYDIFCFANAGVPTLELLAWTNDTTRATAIVLTTTGVPTKSGDLTRRYMGSVRTTAVSGQTEDSAKNRLLFNYTNRVPRPIIVRDTTDSWTYTTAAYHQVNASAANQATVVIGMVETPVQLMAVASASNSSGTATQVSTAIGYDSTTTPAPGSVNTRATAMSTVGITGSPIAVLTHYPAVGYHFYAWLESSDPNATTTWSGDGGGTVFQTGMSGTVMQ